MKFDDHDVDEAVLRVSLFLAAIVLTAAIVLLLGCR